MQSAYRCEAKPTEPIGPVGPVDISMSAFCGETDVRQGTQIAMYNIVLSILHPSILTMCYWLSLYQNE